MADKNILELIKKMLALTTSGTEAEAATAMRMAQKLLQEHNLELADLYKEQPGEYVYRRVNVGGQAVWQVGLLKVLAQHNFCKAFGINGTSEALLIGEAENMDVVEYLNNFIRRELERISRTNYQEVMMQPGSTWARWHPGFMLGAIEVIKTRLEEQTREFKRLNGQTLALVVRKDGELEVAIAPILRSLGFYMDTARQRSTSVDPRAYAAGQAAGRKMDLPSRHSDQAGLPAPK